MNKAEIHEQLIRKLQDEIVTITQAARAAHEAATHEESRAEDSHDTRGLEASYLAGAQAQRAAELKALLTSCRALPTAPFKEGVAIAPGALVELELTDSERKSFYYVVPRGGGVTIQSGSANVLVIAPQSPLGEALMGKRVGDELEVEAQGGVREYLVISVK